MTTMKLPKETRLLVAVGIAIAAGAVAFLSCGKIEAGERGIVIRFGKPVRVATPGLYGKIPFVETIKTVNVRTETVVTRDMNASSKDLQEIVASVTTQCHYDPEKVVETYSKFGYDDFQRRIVVPAIFESVKSAVSKFNAEELITKREEVREVIFQSLQALLTRYNVVLDSLQIADLNFSARFNNAIEEKMIAEQEALKARNVLERVRTEAEQQLAKANATAEAKVLLAEAEAKAIKLQADVIKENGGDQYLLLRAIERWDGRAPTTLLNGKGDLGTLLQLRPEAR